MLPYQQRRFWEQVSLGDLTECWPWNGRVHKNGDSRHENGTAHRAAWELTFGEKPKGVYVRHNCGDRLCCNPTHLRLGNDHGAVLYGMGCRCDTCREGKRIQEKAYRDSHPEVGRARRQRLRLALDAFKTGPCGDCGQTFPPECMDFDHREGEVKSFDIGKSPGRAPEVLRAEIAKCDLVCANCHRIRTRARNQFAGRSGGSH